MVLKMGVERNSDSESRISKLEDGIQQLKRLFLEHLYGHILGNIQNLNAKIQKLNDLRKEKQQLEDEIKKYEGIDQTLKALRDIKCVRTQIDQDGTLKDEKKSTLNDITAQIQRQKDFLETNEAAYQHLSMYHKKYLDLERQLKAQREELQQFEEQKSLELHKHKISEKEAKHLTTDPLETKHYQLLVGIILTAAGITLILTTIVINVFILAVGIPLLAAGFIFLRQYQHFKDIVNLGANIQFLMKSIMKKKLEIDELNRNFDKLKAEAGYHSSAEIGNKISDILVALRFGIGIDSFDALKIALTKNETLKLTLMNEINDLEKLLASSKKRLDSMYSEIEAPSNLDKGIGEYETLSKAKATLIAKLNSVDANIREIENENPQEALEELNKQLSRINVELENWEKPKPETAEPAKHSKRDR